MCGQGYVTDFTFRCRAWRSADDDGLRDLMARQMRSDVGWPPDYARSDDLAAWLGRPATIGRWVAVDTADSIAGHVGLGTLSGAAADLLSCELGCERDRLAEICRLVVEPDTRHRGLASLLTRRAMRSAIEAGRVPVATVLCNRDTWLDMMVNTGWNRIGNVESAVAGSQLAVLLPPQRFVDLAMSSW